MILVTGITGRIGSSLAKYLLERGQEVGGLVRDPKQLESLPDGITGFVGDFEDPDSTEEAMKASESLYLLCGIDAVEELYDVAKKSGVKHVVQLSGVVAVAGETHDAIARFMVHAERTAEASGIAYTFLRPFAFMSNALRWADQACAGNHIRLPFESVAEPLIDPDDIGRVAAAILSAPELHTGKAYQLSGPQPLRPSDSVRIVADAIGRPLEFTALSNGEARIEMNTQYPPEVVEAFMDIYTDESFFDLINVGDDNVERLTSAPPRSFEAWARENRTAFMV
jgi:uncharacterized protein YbjT (DUF2867 family)